MKSITKQEEITLLRNTVARLVKSQAYTGVWLKDQLPFIESAIKSDVMPDIFTASYSEFCAQRQALLDEAQKTASQIKEDAEKEAERITLKAKQDANDYICTARTKVQKAIDGARYFVVQAENLKTLPNTL